MEGETVLCVAPRAWHSMWRSAQQYMSRMAKKNRVLYFEPGRNYERPQLAEAYRNVRYFVSPDAQVLDNNLIIVPTPPSLPYVREHLPQSILRRTAPFVAWYNAAILARQIRWAMRTFDVKAPILWLNEPRQLALAGKFGEKLVCYFVHDEFADLPQNHRLSAFIQEHDDMLTRRADVVFGCSPWVVEKRKQLNPNTHCILNSVDFELFHRALDLETPVPSNMKGLRRPTIGVVGGLDNRIDAGLMGRVAEFYSDSSIVFVGPDGLPRNQSTAALKAMPNVFFVGQMPMEALPQYLKSLDVALIPYEIREDTLPIYPLKLHEYLAAGRSVVSTALPEVRRFSPMVKVAETAEQFIRMVGEASVDYDPEQIQARVAVARQHTWDQRLVEIYCVLDRHLQAATALGGPSAARDTRLS